VKATSTSSFKVLRCMDIIQSETSLRSLNMQSHHITRSSYIKLSNLHSSLMSLPASIQKFRRIIHFKNDIEGKESIHVIYIVLPVPLNVGASDVHVFTCEEHFLCLLLLHRFLWVPMLTVRL